jgi:putative DNA primase/helicase
MNEVAKAGAEDPVATAARIKAEIAEKQKRRREAEIKKAREQESKRIESLKSLVPFKPKEEPKAKTVADEIVEEITAKAKAEEPKAESKSEEPKEEPKAEKKTDGKDDRPVIDLGPKDSPRLLNVVATAMKYLTQRGVQIFQRGGKLMMPVLDPGFDSEGHPVKVASLIQIDEGALQRLLMEHLRWGRKTKDGDVRLVNTMDSRVASLILNSRGAWPFHPVTGVITAPTLRKDGSPLDKQGYDHATGLLLFNSIPVSINLKPSVEDAEMALALLKGLLVEVPFADIDKMGRSPSRSVALSLMLSLAARGALETVPLHGFTAPDIGAGKSYLVNVSNYIVSGRKCAVLGATRRADELEKKIATTLMAGRQLVSIDNVNGVLASELLSQALSEGGIVHRVMAKNVEIDIASKAVFAATGNNLLIADDLVRRTILVRLDPKRECGWDTEFDLDPLEMIAQDRGRYIAAALTIVLAYITAGKPDCPRDLNGFEEWSQLIRGALIWLGEADPLDTMQAVRDSDPRLQSDAAMLIAIQNAFGDESRTAAQMVAAVDEKESWRGLKEFLSSTAEPLPLQRALRDAMAGVCKDGKITTANLSYWLRARNGKVVSGLRLTGEQDRTRLMHWRVVEVRE